MGGGVDLTTQCPPPLHKLIKAKRKKGRKTSNETKKEKELSRSPTSRWNLPKGYSLLISIYYSSWAQIKREEGSRETVARVKGEKRE